MIFLFLHLAYFTQYGNSHFHFPANNIMLVSWGVHQVMASYESVTWVL